MKKERFGELLITLRKERGIKQRELARKLHVTTSAVSKWEHGANLPDVATIAEIANIVGVSCDELMHPEQTLEYLNGQKEPVEKIVAVRPSTEEDPAAEEIVESVEGTEPVIPQELPWQEKTVIKKKFYIKRWWRYAILMMLFLLLGIAGGFGLKAHMKQDTETNLDYEKLGLRAISSRYVQDLNFGKMYEITYVTDQKIDVDFIKEHITELEKNLILGQDVDADTQGVHVYYYNSVDEAIYWKDTEYGGVFLYGGEE